MTETHYSVPVKMTTDDLKTSVEVVMNFTATETEDPVSEVERVREAAVNALRPFLNNRTHVLIGEPTEMNFAFTIGGVS